MTGCVIKRGNKWAVVLELGRDPITKKRKQKSIYGFKLKREAKQELDRILGETADDGVWIEPRKVTLAEYLDSWLPIHARELKDSTAAGYREQVNAYVLEDTVLSAVPLQQLTAHHLDRLYGNLLKRGLSDATVRQLHAVLAKSLSDAVKTGLLRANPAGAATPPSLRKAKESARGKQNYWTPEQLDTILSHLKNDRLFAVWRLAASTGMRRGELLGLKWGNVDLEKGRVSVRDNAVVVRDGVGDAPKTRIDQTTPKSKKSRQVSIDPITVSALRSWRKKQTEELLALGIRVVDMTPVATRVPLPRELALKQEDLRNLDLTIRGDAFGGMFRARLAKIDVPQYRLHDLRHTHAAILIAENIHPLTLSRRLGHSSISVTLDLYGHLLPDLEDGAAAAFAAAVDGTGR